MCPRCHVHLTPIIYGRLTPDLVDLHKKGKIVIGSGDYSSDKPTSICISCEEAYLHVVPLDSL